MKHNPEYTKYYDTNYFDNLSGGNLPDYFNIELGTENKNSSKLILKEEIASKSVKDFEISSEKLQLIAEKLEEFFGLNF